MNHVGTSLSFVQFMASITLSKNTLISSWSHYVSSNHSNIGQIFVSVGVRVTLVAAASSSASMFSASLSDIGGVITFSLPFREMTGMGGSSAGSSSSSHMMCFFLDLEEVLAGGSSSSFSGSSSNSVGELSIVDLTPSSSG